MWQSNSMSHLQGTWPLCDWTLPCSSGPAAAGRQGSCWKQLRSGRPQWSVWLRLQPAWLQPRGESEIGQSALHKPVYTHDVTSTAGGAGWLRNVTQAPNLTGPVVYVGFTLPPWSDKNRLAWKLDSWPSLIFLKKTRDNSNTEMALLTSSTELKYSRGTKMSPRKYRLLSVTNTNAGACFFSSHHAQGLVSDMLRPSPWDT
jgi:hypothetical protein